MVLSCFMMIQYNKIDMQFISKGISTYGKNAGVALAYGLIYLAVNIVIGLVFYPLSIILSFILIPNFAYISLIMVRGRPLRLKDCFLCLFKCTRLTQFFLVSLFNFIFVFLWSLLLIVPGIIKGLGYYMSFYIVAENEFEDSYNSLRKSEMMMEGHKCTLFCLLLILTLPWTIPIILLITVNQSIVLIISQSVLLVIWTPIQYISIGHLYERIKPVEIQPEVQPVPAVQHQQMIEDHPYDG